VIVEEVQDRIALLIWRMESKGLTRRK